MLGLSISAGDKVKTHRFKKLRQDISRLLMAIEEKKVQENA